jgi:GNAT superfamily N-acetyltransferase
MKILQTNTADPQFLQLEKLLDEELEMEFPGEMEPYAPHNKFSKPIRAILIFEDNVPIACGAFKEINDHIEIKRMFVHPDYRGKGYSRLILAELEKWGSDLGYTYAILETGIKLIKAVKLYQSSGYSVIPNYGPYTHLESSICMKKGLDSADK